MQWRKRVRGGWEYPAKERAHPVRIRVKQNECGKMSAATALWHERTAAFPPLRESPDGLGTTTFDRDIFGSGSP
jgi:hypothetical protein